MFKEIEFFCKQNHLFQKGDTILVACSGGADSLALLYFFLSIRNSWNIKIIVAHFNHMIRGIDSSNDAVFVETICAKENVSFVLGKENVPEYAKQNKLSLETAARELRYAFLFSTKKNYDCTLLATAHHFDDQAETVLMHLIKGTGTSGLCAIKPKNGFIIRPFLSVPKKKLENICTALNITPVFDVTNTDPTYLRNNIRLNLIPYLEKNYNPAIKKSLTQLSTIASDEIDFFNYIISKIKPSVIKQKNNKIYINRIKFSKLHIALARILLCDIIKSINNISLTFSHIEILRQFTIEGSTGKYLTLPKKIKAKNSYNETCIYIDDPLEKNKDILNEKLSIENPVTLPHISKTISMKIKTSLSSNHSNDFAIYDANMIKLPLWIRYRKNGDIIKTNVGKKKLKDLFIDLKIPKEIREKIPLIVDNENNILWIYGIKKSTYARINSETSKFLLLEITSSSQ